MAVKGMTVFTHQGEDYTINDPNNAQEFDTSVSYAVGDYVTYQGNLYRFNETHAAGSWNSSHVDAVNVGGRLKTAEYSIAETQSKTTFVAKGKPGKNLFDKTGEYNTIISDYYRDYTTGKLKPINTGWSVINFPVTAGEKYVVNDYNMHVCFFADDCLYEFISGFLVNTTNGQTFTVPATAKQMTISVNTEKFDTLMVQHGVISTPDYYPFTIGVDGNDVTGNAVVKAVTGKNLYDKTGAYTEIVTGRFRDYRDGHWGANETFEADFYYNLEGGVSYAFNINNCHVCFYSDEYATEYLDGVLITSSDNHVFTTPNGTKSMSISMATGNKETAQLEKGTAMTQYEHFKHGIKSTDIIGSGAVFHVGSTREYTTIQSAVDEASNGDVIYIDPGTYIEAVDMVGKHLHLIGSGGKKTIIQYAGDDYYYPPLEASKGLIEDVGFVTTATEPAQGAIDTSYCVHIDYDDEAGNSLTFKNCYFKSNGKHTVGIGLRENFTLNFTGCEFTAPTAPIMCHEQQANNKLNQRIELVDCSIYCSGTDNALLIQESSEFSGNQIILLMQRCIAKAAQHSGDSIIRARVYPGGTTPTGSNYLNMNYWYLDNMSALNNESILNA